MARQYNGHRSWNAWNVCLWIYGTEYLYRLAQDVCRAVIREGGTVEQAAALFIDRLGDSKTPDGAVYNRLSVKLALKDLFEEVQRG